MGQPLERRNLRPSQHPEVASPSQEPHADLRFIKCLRSEWPLLAARHKQRSAMRPGFPSRARQEGGRCRLFACPRALQRAPSPRCYCQAPGQEHGPSPLKLSFVAGSLRRPLRRGETASSCSSRTDAASEAGWYWETCSRPTAMPSTTTATTRVIGVGPDPSTRLVLGPLPRKRHAPSPTAVPHPPSPPWRAPWSGPSSRRATHTTTPRSKLQVELLLDMQLLLYVLLT